MIIYIHGFCGSGGGSKAKVFRKYFKSISEDFIAPSLSYVPVLAIKTLEELIESYHKDVYLIGSSLGGYYTMYLAQKYNLKAVLINPAIQPANTLQRVLGEVPNFMMRVVLLGMKNILRCLKFIKRKLLTREILNFYFKKVMNY